MKQKLTILTTLLIATFISQKIVAQRDDGAGTASCDKYNSNVCKITGKDDSTGRLIVVTEPYNN